MDRVPFQYPISHLIATYPMRSMLRFFQSLWNYAGVSTTLLSRCMHNFKAIRAALTTNTTGLENYFEWLDSWIHYRSSTVFFALWIISNRTIPLTIVNKTFKQMKVKLLSLLMLVNQYDPKCFDIKFKQMEVTFQMNNTWEEKLHLQIVSLRPSGAIWRHRSRTPVA